MVSTMVPVGLSLIATTWRLGSIMGRIDEKLGDHDRRIEDIERNLQYRPSERRPGHAAS